MSVSRVILTWLLIFTSWSLTTSNGTGPKVTFTSGTVEGLEVLNPMGKIVEAFLGIPFAEAPLGVWRFKPPRPAAPWSGILQTKKATVGCPQKLSMFFDTIKNIPVMSGLNWFETQSEDCLKLNVWRPKEQRDEKRPVMVWIHGGSFMFGSASVDFFRGDILVAEEEVVLVTINYRLGPLGFMYLGTSDVPGNAGMYDQLLALKWVKKNIAAFGGDPKKVTIFGQSAGSASVGYHILSPLTSGLFHRAIMQSGSPNAPWAYKTNREVLSTSLNFAAEFGCKSSNLSVVTDCLQSLPIEDIILKEPMSFPITLENMALRPTKDGSFLPKNPDELLNIDRVRKVDIMIGDTENDGSFVVAAAMPFHYPLVDVVHSDRSSLRTMLDTLMPNFSENAKRLVFTEYNDWTDNDDTQTVQIAVRLLTDYLFYCPNKRFGETVLRTGRNVFKYVLSHRTTNSPAPKWLGVVHCEDILMVFGVLLRKSNASARDVAVTRTIMRYWGNFAKYGFVFFSSVSLPQ